MPALRLPGQGPLDANMTPAPRRAAAQEGAFVSAFARVSSLPIPDPDPDPDPDSWEAFIDGAAAGRADSAPLGSPTAEPAGGAEARNDAGAGGAAGARPGGAGDAAAAAADTGASRSRLGRQQRAGCWAAPPAPVAPGSCRFGLQLSCAV